MREESPMEALIRPGQDVERAKEVVVQKNITREDIILFCATVGLTAPSLSDPRKLQPLLQTFAAGPAWTAAARLVGSDSIQISSHLAFATPVEIGDTITAVAQAEEQRQGGALKIRLICRNQRGKLVLKGQINARPTRPA